MNGTVTEITRGVYWVGARDPGRTTFDALVPLPLGTTYNAYLIKGTKKTALLDTVDPTRLSDILNNLDGVPKIDYIISHHSEQDHSGSIGEVMKKYPLAKVVTSPKGKEFLVNLLHIDETRILSVKNHEKLSLGGKTLEFIYIPWSHWPETMASFLHEDKILFPCDLFGAHMSTGGLYEDDTALVESAAKRYYAEIMMPYAAFIKNHLPLLKSLGPVMIAPSHGPIHAHPSFILNLYEKWINGPSRNLVLLPYVSMHGSTQQMVSALAEKLSKRKIDVAVYNTAAYDIGQFAMDLVDASTIIFASPTVLYGLHPAVASVAFITNILKPKAKHIGMIGSMGWGGHAHTQLHHLLDELDVEFLNPVLCKGLPREKDYERLDALVESIAKRHNGLTSPASLSARAIK